MANRSKRKAPGILGVILIAAGAAAAAASDSRLVGPGERATRPNATTRPERAAGSRAKLHPRSNYAWPHASGPHYRVDDVNAPGVLRTTAGTFFLERLDIPGELTAGNNLDRLDAQYFAIQCQPDPAVEDALRAAIRAAGGAVVDSPSDATLIARLNAAALRAIRAAAGVVAIEPYHPAFKLDPRIGRVPLFDREKALSDVYELDVLLWPGESARTVAAEIVELGGHVTRLAGDSLVVELHRSMLPELAALEGVRSVHEHLPPIPFGEETTTTVQTGGYNAGATPYHDAGIDGSGGGFGFCTGDGTTGCQQDSPDCDGNGTCDTGIAQVLMVLDSGIQLDAGDLADRRTDAGVPGPTHRKVRAYETTRRFGGSGDLLGCDAPARGGFTHGHGVASTALGRATAVGTDYGGLGWNAFDAQGNAWKLDGVAPGAVLVAYDAHLTPPVGDCLDPANAELHPGDLYDPGGVGYGRGSLGQSYDDLGARVVNFSWGDTANTYGAAAQDIDRFLQDKSDALVLVAAGNGGEPYLPGSGSGEPPYPGEQTINSVATAKNGLAIGACRNTGIHVSLPEGRERFSSVGPAVSTTANRVAPQLMAPGGETDLASLNLGIPSEFACRTHDDDDDDPVECDLISGLESTSFSSAAAAGAAMLVRDYFAQGYYPDAVAKTSNQVPSVSGALVKALLVSSADFMTGANLWVAHRFNNEQGYGRIQLDKALPLESWSRSPAGLVVHDPWSGTSDLGLATSLTTGAITSAPFKVCNPDEELRIALAWTDLATVSPALRHDLDLSLTSPSGIEYRGNYFTDLAGDCGGIGAVDADVGNGVIDAGEWSLPVCSNTSILGKDSSPHPFDNANPTEAVFLSPDPDGDGTGPEGVCTPTSEVNPGGPCRDSLDCRGTPGGAGDCECVGCYRQTEAGEWTITVRVGSALFSEFRNFAVAIAGGVCLGSSVRFDSERYACNAQAVVAVSEIPEAGTVGDIPDANDVSSRVTIEVVDGVPGSPTFGQVVDAESGLAFGQPDTDILTFYSDPVRLTGGTARDPGNGVLDVRSGDQVTVTYQDVDPDTGGPGPVRRSTARVDCEADISFGDVVFAQFGQDTSVLVEGGCERSARGQFEFGFPDRYMDAGELVVFSFGFASRDAVDLTNVTASLECVEIDADSPLGCLPDGSGCEPGQDPRRENNPPCAWMTVLDSPKTIGLLPSHAATSANFSIRIAGDGPGQPFEDTGSGQPTPTVEMLLTMIAEVEGNTQTSVAVNRYRLNVDELSLFYSTDFPAGGTEIVDAGPGNVGNNDEIAQNPISETGGGPGSNDYRFETTVYSPLTATGRNLNLLSPWNFDANDGGFTVGFATPTKVPVADVLRLHNWGEDKNFNGIEDGVCVADPSIMCYDFGIDTDPRCPPGTECESIENPRSDSDFTQNWNTKGGCGWQTRATGECTGDDTRGCFVDADCEGTCQVEGNPIASTLDRCGALSGTCPTAWQCSDSIGVPNPLAPCTSDADCGGVPGACVSVPQICVGDAGTCGSVVGDHTGGVWHTGPIGTPDQICDGSIGSACANHDVLPGSSGTFVWWGLLVTPVMEKVNQGEGPDGLPTHGIEITNWAWNQQIDLRDHFAVYAWELDTDLEKLGPVDLFSDATVLNSGPGPYGAVHVGPDPAMTNGWSIFAPLCACTTAPFGTCTSLFECSPGACSVSGDTCHVVTECDPGQCTWPPQDCFSNDDCPAGFCDGGGDGTALGEPCHNDADCEAIAGPGAQCWGGEECNNPLPEGCAGAPQCDCSGLKSVNGSLGGNRVGDAGCFFEGQVIGQALADIGLARPRDDDLDNDRDGREDGTPGAYDCDDGLDNDGDGFCDLPISTCTDASTPGDPECELWVDGGNEKHGIDEFVTPAGPYRNHDLSAWNGPDMRFDVLSDLYGDTGNSFQGAIGFVNFQGTPASQAQTSYGLAIDDMVVTWREFELVEDATDCLTSGACAVVVLDTTNVYEGIAALGIRLLEPSPEPENDCDLDGFTDGTDDCDGDGTRDVVVNATSQAEPLGETVFLNRVGGTDQYAGSVTVSSLRDDPGVVFVAPQGVERPTVTVTYLDSDDGTGNPCPNDADPSRHGIVQAVTSVFLGSICEVTVVDTPFTDNGDGDVFVDTEETVDMQVCVINNCGGELHNCAGRLFSNSPEVDCILDSTIDMGDLADSDEIVCITDGFRWKLADVSRNDVDEILEVSFNFTMTCDEIDALEVPQEFSLTLDLDFDTQGQMPAEWLESFEGGDLASSAFFAENIDAVPPGLEWVPPYYDGWRCQYHDPDWVNSNGYGSAVEDCYPGMSLDQVNAIWWQVDGIDTGSPDGGRAKSGNYSLYYGAYLTDPAGNFTTPVATVESVATDTPINLGVGTPELSFWHQINLMDWTNLNTDFMTSADRGVVQYKTVDLAGDDTSDWMNLQPFQNTYDQQAYSNYYNCQFDPVDDGTTEDDFFDPTDPDRRLGPSSTCFPEFIYACMGDTDDPFQVENICNATKQPTPADQGSLGTGTWVQSKVDLTGLRGRRIHLRFLVSSLDGGTGDTYEEWFNNNPSPEDDGWWIDDVTIDETLANPALLLVDSKVLQHCAGDPTVGCITDQNCIDADTTGPCTGEAPQCPETCTSIRAQIVTDPDDTGGALDELLAVPGQPIELDASSSFGTCLDGALQFRFARDGGATILREFSENPVFIAAPLNDTDYLVEVRCSTDTSCMDSVVADVDVECPSSGNLAGIFPTIIATDKTTWTWTPAKTYLLWQGDLALVDSYAGSESTGSGTSFTHLPTPAVGGGHYYLVRELGEYCNEDGPWTSGGPAESPLRDVSLP